MASGTGESWDYHPPSDEETNLELSIKMKEWKESAFRKPLKFFVAGKGGVGKSALINNLLGLGDEERANEGFTGEATTRVVQKYVGRKHNVEVHAFDTPGLNDLNVSDQEILAELSKQTGSLCDVFLYCTSLERRVDKGDEAIISLITRAFSTRTWERTVFVLTFANSERVQTNKDYEQLVETTKSRLCDCLRLEKVDKCIIQDAIFCTAGYTNPALCHEDCFDWQDRLYLAMMNKADPSIVLAMLQFRWGYRAVLIACGSGVLLGAGIGAGVGFATGGPVGCGIGVGVGAAVGVTLGSSTYMTEKLKNLMKKKYKEWKGQNVSE